MSRRSRKSLHSPGGHLHFCSCAPDMQTERQLGCHGPDHHLGVTVHRFPLPRCSSATRLVCHGDSGRASLCVEPSKHQAEDEGPLSSGQELMNWMEASFQTEQLYRQQPCSDSFCTSESKQGQTQRSLSSCPRSRLRLHLQFESCLRLYSSRSSAAV